MKRKTCAAAGCATTPSFNVAGAGTGKFCAKHRTPGMKNVTGKTCTFDGGGVCSKFPAFHFPGKKGAGALCGTHKLEGMVNVTPSGHTCLFTSEDGVQCLKKPAFNTSDRQRRAGKFCAAHRAPGMVNVTAKTCEYSQERCLKFAGFNVAGERGGKFCATHKQDGMVCVTATQCASSWCSTQVNGSTHEGYCLRCFVHLFPDKPVSRNYKTKERLVVDFVIAAFPSVTWATDKRVADGCSARRPDLLCDMGDHVIIVEVDENEHVSYDSTCENKRLMQLSQDVGHRPIVFIRFNPDDYVTPDGVRISSCFGVDGRTGILRVKKQKVEEWTGRLDALKSALDAWLGQQQQRRASKTVEVIHLFFSARQRVAAAAAASVFPSRE